jgi:translation initiation factor eIF-2B subunit delta
VRRGEELNNLLSAHATFVCTGDPNTALLSASTTYYFTSASHITTHCQVFLGASAVMSNGTVMGRAGSAAVAMVASSHRKPVIVCCESFKFHERVQLDAITHNELGDPDVLAAIPGQPDTQRPLVGWRVSVFVCAC